MEGLLCGTPRLPPLEQPQGKTTRPTLPAGCPRQALPRCSRYAAWLRDQRALHGACLAIRRHLSSAGLSQLSTHEGQALVLLRRRRPRRTISESAHLLLAVRDSQRFASCCESMVCLPVCRTASDNMARVSRLRPIGIFAPRRSLSYCRLRCSACSTPLAADIGQYRPCSAWFRGEESGRELTSL